MSHTLKEERITISGMVSIGATVTYTDKNTLSPAIVVIMGTGKTDCDGNEKGFRTDLYKQFAEFFAALGFVCVRYDKRGTFQSTGNFNTAGLHDLTDDAISVIRYVKSLPYVDETKVLVCGHSEGAMIATLLSEKEDTAGLMLFGGAATSMKDALFYQNVLAADEFQHKKGLLGMLLRSQTSKEKTNAKIDAMFQKVYKHRERQSVFQWCNIQCEMGQRTCFLFHGGLYQTAEKIRQAHSGDYEDSRYFNGLQKTLRIKGDFVC